LYVTPDKRIILPGVYTLTNNTPVSKIIALFLTGLYALCLIAFFFIGQLGMMYQGAPAGQPPGPGQLVSLGVYVPALFPLAALLAVAVGFVADRWIWLAWLGVLAFIATGVLLIFGMGIVIFLCAFLLFVPIALTHWHISNHRRWLHIAWIGIAGLVVYGILFRSVVFGPISLAIAATYAVWVGVLEWETSQDRSFT
jgi:hypothetical protein